MGHLRDARPTRARTCGGPGSPELLAPVGGSGSSFSVTFWPTSRKPALGSATEPPQPGLTDTMPPQTTFPQARRFLLLQGDTRAPPAARAGGRETDGH